MRKVALSFVFAAFAGLAASHAGTWTSAYIPTQVQSYKSVASPNHLGVVSLNGLNYACDLDLKYCEEGIELVRAAIFAGRSMQLEIHNSALVPGQWDGGSVNYFRLVEGFSLKN